MNAKSVLDREFFEIRAKILELAASLDRMDRGEGDIGDDSRIELIQKAISIVSSNDSNRAEQIQMLFSREFSENWRAELGVTIDV